MRHRLDGRTRSDAVAELSNVHVVGEGDAPILQGVSLAVRPGERVLITGESGSGKSTLLRAMGAIVTPSAGEVRLFGQDLAALSPKQRRHLIASQVGVGFQAPNLHDGRTVIENIMTTWDTTRGSRPRREGLARVAEIAPALGITIDMLSRRAHTLSGGQKQRVATARLLVPRPELILLDEPTAALDSHGDFGKEAAYRVIDEDASRTGATVVMVSHDEAARSIATREIVMDGGLIVADIPLRLQSV